MKKLSFFLLIPAIVLTASFAAASMMIPASDQAKEHAKAPEKSPVIGDNWDLERVDFIHYAKPERPAKPGKPTPTETCYKLMGVKWTSLPVQYLINPMNADGLSDDFVAAVVSVSAETWDEPISSELFNDTYSIDKNTQYGKQDYKNVIAFGNYKDSNVIAVTSVWYTRRAKQIVEFDMLFNDYYNWGDAEITPGVMDLQNIATHEFGHGIGLSDIYTSSCSEVTMYGYSDNGDISKRTLEQPDIIGVTKLYGN